MLCTSFVLKLEHLRWKCLHLLLMELKKYFRNFISHNLTYFSKNVVCNSDIFSISNPVSYEDSLVKEDIVSLLLTYLRNLEILTDINDFFDDFRNCWFISISASNILLWAVDKHDWYQFLKNLFMNLELKGLHLVTAGGKGNMQSL